MKYWSRTTLLAIFSVLIITLAAGPAISSKPKKIRFVSVSWTGVTVKTNLGVDILEQLGYSASNTVLPVPLVYKALETGDADIFLGNWMPSMESIANRFFDNGSVVKTIANMPGAKYTLAAPSYAVDAGLKDFSDIARFGEKLDYKIYGIEPGNDGNLIIKSMIDNNMFGLGKFKLIETSEPMMLSQVRAYTTEDKWIVFLGWAPHSMNAKIDMKYLTGSTGETFGGDDGTATVFTNIRKGFDSENPNVAHFLNNFNFSVSMMNEIMAMMDNNKKLNHLKAGLLWVKDHPEVYRKWLDGVTTIDGKPALPVFEQYIQTI